MTVCVWREEPQRLVLELPADLDLLAATPLAEELRRALAQDKPVTVAAGAVQRLNTACIQVLLAATRTPSGTRLRLAGPSDLLVETCAVLGLASWLSEWSD